MANLAITPTSNINATSTVSGTVRALKHITSGSIAATSTVSGKVVAKHIIRPTTSIAATSTVSGSILRVKKILPATINAITTFTFPGYVLSVKFITGSINATTTFSASILLKPGNILPANIMATSKLFEMNLIFATVPAGSYGVSDTEDGII